MNKLLYTLAALAAAFSLGSCQVEILDTDTPDTAVHGFTINAGYGGPDTKAAFDSVGLDMKWTPGDKLYMIDPEGENPTIELTTDITEPAKIARFHTDALVPVGFYTVVFGQSELQIFEKDINIKKDVSELNDQIRLYGYVDVGEGQTSADITLHQLYTMLSFNFVNVPTEYPMLYLGMAVCTKGMTRLDSGVIGINGLSTENSGTFVAPLGIINGTAGYTFIAPVDLSNNQIIFFVQGVEDYTSNRHVYEIFKPGTNLQAGKRYNITFDFNAQSTKHVTLSKSEGIMNLNNADDFLAAALIQWTNSVNLTADVDFSGKAFLPLNVSFLNGNGHTLSGIQCGLDDCSYVGVVSDGDARNLNVTESVFKGVGRVGAITGKGYCESCSASDVRIEGHDYVGGLVGYATADIKDCSLLGVDSVIGNDYVGGFVGCSNYTVSNCLAKGEYLDVNGNKYVGGVAGSAAGAVECGYEGRVVGKDRCVGGVTGEGQCTRCYYIGNITAYERVGGVSGIGDCTDCYCIGTVSGGESEYRELTAGGISGTMSDSPKISNCYFCGSVSNNCGICVATPAADLACTNLTSTSNLYKETDMSLLSHCDVGVNNEFVDFLEDINGNGAYLPLVWDGNDDGCPILKWQYEGYGGDLNIPGYENTEL